ncbi:Fungal transcriptional regulatory N-terminal [Fusarium albosuccineum]|uniref:Fungal transcriptional regulatory N-terminal n=1 Tax=Fusarium albosuccineum TaxID=1237068 RepID=A0A8H4KL87_9HYPO|nr:Fungal transcriptional regulatory N-terminal [Fusarium albosuccineum]
MPLKRPHTKTRHGCRHCRSRRVRCDLHHPACGNCTKRQVKCPYLDDSPPVVVQHIADRTAWQTDLRLMHQYNTSTCFTMANNESLNTVWQIQVPKLAFNHDFLLSGTLALAALHRSSLATTSSSESQFLVAAARHHGQRAIQSYIPALRSATDQNCHAIFAFSIILASYHLATIRYDHQGESSSDLLDRLISVSRLLKGSITIAYRYRYQLHIGPLSAMMGMGLSSTDLFVLPDGPRQSLNEVQYDALHTPDLPSARLDICLPALNSLAHLFRPVPDLAEIIAWLAFGSEEFSGLIASKDPLALVLLAHYAAALDMNIQVWHLKGLGTKMLDAIMKVIDPQYAKYLDWPVWTLSFVEG